ncbi:uncharacterized protein LOC123873137 [Maniola jurtina]|uniref:uncharacterized protein LOC123873137 n=1 Tax=Maniola jurtina TaxID=191418 RepID=UPI001E68737F|nr:uncharacterized protein LOC123873137 [Maniola jurtina]XP_045773807.1 uncharacterized protein LOC123873137 [Maniola jurtina]
MPKYLLLLFIIIKNYEVAPLPSHFLKPKDISPVDTHHRVPSTHNYIQQVARKKKGPNIPYQTYFVQNLHVIPISYQVHTENVNRMQGQHNFTQHIQQLIPVLIPFHNYVPVHDLTVIPLHRVLETKSGYGEDVNPYRNPLGGYGAGSSLGGQGAGHGFHYTNNYFI